MSDTAIARLYRRIRMAVAPGRVTATDDGSTVQTMQVTLGDGQVVDGVPAPYAYGLTSRPHPGGDVVFLAGQGDRGNGVVVAVNDQRYRLIGLAEGEVALYTDEGDYVKLARGRVIQVVAGTELRITAPLVTISGNLHVAGAVIAGFGGADSVGLQSHTHQQGVDGHGDAEAPTNAPTAGT